MNPTAIYSKTGKGVQEASGKTSLLSRADRAVLAQIDGKTNFADLQIKFYKMAPDKLEALILQFDKDGFVREVTSGAFQDAAPVTPLRPSVAKPSAKTHPPSGPAEELDFTAAPPAVPTPAEAPPQKPQVDLAAQARAEAERKAKEQELLDYRARQEAEARVRAEAERKARAEAEAKVRAEADAAVKAAREAAVRAAAEAKAKAEAEAKARTEAAERERQAAAERERAALERAHKEAEEKARVEAELNARLDAERKAREEAERKAKDQAEQAAREAAERERERMEQAGRETEELRRQLEEERKAKLAAEQKAREAAERKLREETERLAREAAERERLEQARREAEEKARREAEELRRQLEEERKAKLEAEQKAREEAERKVREEAERKAREETERRAREEGERKAKEEAEHKAREAAERERVEQMRREAEEKVRRETEELRRLLEEERRAKEEAERRAKEEAERRAREDAERRAKEETERKAREEAQRHEHEAEERRRREEDERRRQEEEARRKREAEEAAQRAEKEARGKREDEEKTRREREERARRKIEAGAAAAKAEQTSPPASQIDASLFADLNAFSQREEEERKAKEEADRKAKEEAERKAEERRRRAEEEARRAAEEERRRRQEEERAREQERLAREEAERKAREEEERKARAAAESKQKAAAAYAAKKADQAAEGDIGVKDEDLDMEDVKRDRKALVGARKREREQERVEQRKEMEAAPPAPRPSHNWGRKAAIGLVVLILAAVAVVHVMPISTAEYEKAAAQAIGQPVKIGSARLSLVTGVELKLERVSVGEAARIGLVRAHPGIGSLFGTQKSFGRVDLENAVIGQEVLGEALLGALKGEDPKITAITAKQLKLEGPIALPALDLDVPIAGDGTPVVRVTGPEKLQAQLNPKGGEIAFEASAGTFALPFIAAFSLSEFAMKGSATRQGMTISEFDGRLYEGVVSGTARIRWGGTWTVDGEVRARGLNVGVFAPALVSEGRVEGRGNYTMSGPEPGKLGERAHIEGTLKIEKGVLGSFDLGRAIQGGGPVAGRTPFSELTAQGLYDKGAIQLRNVSINAGALNAGASVDIAADGALGGRVVADLKTLRATLVLGGKIQDPVLRK